MNYNQPYYNGGYYPQYQNGAVPDILNQYKGQFQPMMHQTFQPPSRTPSNDIIWVQGEAGAKAYIVAPNTTITLWDSENPTIYLKTADSSGIPSMRILDFTERTPVDDKIQQNAPAKHECQCGKEFVHIKDFDELKAKYEHLEDIVNSMIEKTTEANSNYSET